MANLTLDHSILAAALEGLELQKSRIDEQISQVRTALGKGGSSTKAAAASSEAAPAKASGGAQRELSAAARSRIAAAQKKRWAEYRKQKAAAAQG